MSCVFFFSSRRRHTRLRRDWSSDVCSSDLTGYPRFVYNGFCQRLFEECRVQFAREGEVCQAYPSAAAAKRCAQFLSSSTSAKPRVSPLEKQDVHVVCFPNEQWRTAMDFWQHTGAGISSRQAEACLLNLTAVDGRPAEASIRRQIADLNQISSDDRSEEHTSELQSRRNLVCRLLLEKKTTIMR